MNLHRARATAVTPLKGALAVVAVALTATACGAGLDPQEALAVQSLPARAETVTDSSQTVPFSGSQVVVTAPAGATALQVTAVGGSGGSDGAGDQTGGFGAVVKATVSISTPGQQFAVFVGGQGGSGVGSGGQGSPIEVGGSGGGSGGAASGGGGGATFIMAWDPTTQGGADLVIAAGGGGAGGDGSSAGDSGGGGGNAGASPLAGAVGGGAQPGGGGPAGTPEGPPMGQGGIQSPNAVGFGGGGGAGFGGGNGGNSSQYGGGGGGGGGFSFSNGLLTNVTITTADAPGNGVALLQWTTG